MSIKYKNHLYNKMKQSGLRDDLNTYNKYKQTLNKLIKKLERYHYRDQLQLHKSNLKKNLRCYERHYKQEKSI